MENKIKLLPEIVANQIAAGEVVNNPSSVVKEMMENAIDAGASSVTVNFRNAGMELLQIVDDGCGMSPMDARMAFDRHATSKITSLDDVYSLHTFGFRGEALASIAAVSQVELRTRQKDDDVGTVTTVNGGEFVAQTPVMCPVGSQFLVRNLFYTAPARRKFNADRTRMVSDIKKEFRRVALCNPQVRCELMSNDMPIITLPAGTLLERIIDVVGRHIKTNLLEVSVETSIVKVRGYVGRPSAAKQKNAEQYMFINGRYFRSVQFFRSIMKAYYKLIPENCSPSYFLYLTVDPERVDVNVHPQKTEVRFADNDEVSQILNAAVRSTLAKSGAVSMMDFDNSASIDIPAMTARGGVVYTEPKASSNADYNPFREDYADASAPAADVDFTGFGAPYDGSSESVPIRDIPSADIPSAERPVSVRGGSRDIYGGGRPSSEGGDSGGRKLRDIVWSEMPLDSEFAIDAAPRVPAEDAGYREIASVGMTGADDLPGIESAAVSVAEDAVAEESRLEFIPSAAVQQRLATDEKITFSDVLSLGNGYAVAVCDGRSMIADMRRVRERVLFDGYMSMIGHGSSSTQRLLFPERLVLSEDDYALLEENAVEFAALGFDMEFRGDGAVELCGVPSSVAGEQADRLLYELLRETESDGDAGERMRENLARAMAVKGARSAAKGLRNDEAADLLRQLSDCENFSFSPSGKPIMAELTAEELKNKLN